MVTGLANDAFMINYLINCMVNDKVAVQINCAMHKMAFKCDL